MKQLVGEESPTASAWLLVSVTDTDAMGHTGN